MNWRANVPSWITVPILTPALIAAIVVGAFFIVGWVKPYLFGPDLALTTLYRPKTVPVQAEPSKLIKNAETKTVSTPRQVITKLPPKDDAKLKAEFGKNLADLHAENKELATVLTIPKASNGGEIAITTNNQTGVTEGIFRPKPKPFYEFGGIREVGIDYNVIQRGVTGYYRQDLVRIGPGVVNGKAFVTMPLSPGQQPSYGAMIGVAVRF